MLQEGAPVALQEVPALDLHRQAVDLQLLAQEGLLVEEVAPHEDEGLAVYQALAYAAVANLAQNAGGRANLLPRYS